MKLSIFLFNKKLFVLFLCTFYDTLAENRYGSNNFNSKQNIQYNQKQSIIATSSQSSNVRQGRSELLDVEKLNNLLKSLDKTWVLPRPGSKEPVGSNFQFKKTCASIYKARHGACSQMGFGIMCFNYCYEQGEVLSFSCQDASDSVYCKNNGNFDQMLSKSRKDPYKSKSYVHQTLSRCYATAICNSQGLLNSTIIDNNNIQVNNLAKNNEKNLVKNVKETNSIVNINNKYMKKNLKIKNENINENVSKEDDIIITTSKPNIWDRFTIGAKDKTTPKHLPFWQKLLQNTTKEPKINNIKENNYTKIDDELLSSSTEKTIEITEKSEESDEELDEVTTILASTSTTTTTTTTTTPKQKLKKKKTKKNKISFNRLQTQPLILSTTSSDEDNKNITDTLSTTLNTTENESEVQEKTDITPNFIDSDSLDEESNTIPNINGFWTKFQPGKWYQSVYYMTNTGKK